MPKSIRPKTERGVAQCGQLTSALAALRDLAAGYPWRELHVDLDTMLANAAQLGITLED